MTRLHRGRVRDQGRESEWLALLAELVGTAPREQMSTLVQDVRHAWRTWRRSSALALAAILTLSLGVGANTAVFSVVHAVLLRQLPYPDADRLVEVFEDNSRAGGGLARRLWGNGNSLGRVLEFDGRSHEVVGVAGDIRGSDGTARGGGLDRDPQPVLYLSSAQFPQGAISLVIRTDATVQAIMPAIRAAAREIDSALPIPDLRPLDEWIVESAAQARLTTTMAAAFAGAALFLTIVGIYGVISYAVGQRTQEIGVRIALGARRASVLGLVLRGGMTWAGGGIALGLVGAWSMSRAITSLLFDVSATDPFTFTLTAFGVTGVAVLACTVPALRATRIDPVVALRGD